MTWSSYVRDRQDRKGSYMIAKVIIIFLIAAHAMFGVGGMVKHICRAITNELDLRTHDIKMVVVYAVGIVFDAIVAWFVWMSNIG